MLDVLAFGAHPDDVEIFMGGTIARLKKDKLKVGVCDLTRGEAGTYGSAETRSEELQRASDIMGLDIRVTLDIPDGSVSNTEENRLKVIDVIRQYRPKVVFTFVDLLTRHPDHYYTGVILKECMFLSGLEKIKTNHAPYRPEALIQFPELIPRREPDVIVDITEFWETKIAAIQAYSSQVTVEFEKNPRPKTFLRSEQFWEVLEARSRLAGAQIGVKYGEPFYTQGPFKYTNLDMFVKGY
ncbi:MAG: bacillithiol biosynthesis deacetylase BshB1 [Calditrichia bacterium]